MQVLQHGQQEQQLRARTFLGCDNAPITFQVCLPAVVVLAWPAGCKPACLVVMHEGILVQHLCLVVMHEGILVQHLRSCSQCLRACSCVTVSSRRSGCSWLGRDVCSPPPPCYWLLDSIHAVQEMMDATAASGKYEGSVQFTGSEGPGKGKVLDNSASRAALSWQPQYASYQQFMSRGAVDVYSLEAPLQGLGLKHG